MMKKSFLGCFFLVFLLNLSAQDIKFSQFYNSPLNLNPALTGKTPGLMRFVANYRNQDNPVVAASAYSTLGASADFGLLRDRMNDNILGVGLLINSDNQGAGALKTIQVYTSAAYHLGMGYDKKHWISSGFQFGIVQRRIDVNSFYWQSQYVPNQGFDQTLPSLENIQNNSIIYPNLNAGLFWNSNFNKVLSAFGGMGLFNVLKPKESFEGDESERDLRINGHAGVAINLNNFVMLTPNAIYKQQSKATDWIAGMQAGFNLSGKRNPYEMVVYVGGWYDGSKSFIASTGFQYQGIQVGISYDATLNELKMANKGYGGLELSLIYQSKGEEKKKYPLMHCPAF